MIVLPAVADNLTEAVKACPAVPLVVKSIVLVSVATSVVSTVGVGTYKPVPLDVKMFPAVDEILTAPVKACPAVPEVVKLIVVVSVATKGVSGVSTNSGE